jgi:hypothetical protein
MNKATNKMAKRIAALTKDIDRKPPAEQLTTYFTVGEKLACMVEDEAEYGPTAVADVVSLVPLLTTETYGYRIMNLSRYGDEAREFMLKETANPMDNGKPLTLGHWFWLFRHRPNGSTAESDAWLRRELEWLREESPSASVLDHVEEVWEGEHEREMDRVRESIQDAICMLDEIQRTDAGNRRRPVLAREYLTTSVCP